MSRLTANYIDLIAKMRLFLQRQHEITMHDPYLPTEASYCAFYGSWDDYLHRLEDLLCGVRQDRSLYDAYRPALQTALHAFLLRAPSIGRVYRRPLGFPGDYLVMEALWGNHNAFVEGCPPLAAYLERHALNIPLAEANRGRMRFLAGEIVTCIQQQPQARILSLASGPAIELRLVIAALGPYADRAQVTLVDSEQSAVDHSMRILEDRRAGCTIALDPRVMDAISFLRGPGKDMPPFDLIYAFGLCDYLRDYTCSALLRRAWRLLTPGGRIIVANYGMDGHHHRAYLDLAMEWDLFYRTEADLARLAQQAQINGGITHPRPGGLCCPVQYMTLTKEDAHG